ncbi:F-box domain-containing protein [Brazilian cedratvirus IHUMI]|uniref:F-box domain-containing protein n=1 Tax=Brazilian cedratvirus IHUMI TaxID=2126980 RepID=A0A2R8FE21_9VIRU|nr:F-box domain-containing protein [Brazilian cedratvirus IHUMI]
MLSPLIIQEIALAGNDLYLTIRLGQICSSWRSVCNSDSVWKNLHESKFRLAPCLKESILLYSGFEHTYKYLCYTTDKTLSRREMLREYKRVENRLYHLCRGRCGAQANCIRGNKFYFCVSSVLMDREEFIEFLHSFSTFSPLVTKELLCTDYSLLVYEAVTILYAFLLFVCMSPILCLLLWLFSRLC